MKAEQLKHFHQALKDHGDREGRRCAKALQLDDPGLFGAAIGMSLLTLLRELSHTKDLGPNDMQKVIDSFYEAALIEESRHPMGNLVYERKKA